LSSILLAAQRFHPARIRDLLLAYLLDLGAFALSVFLAFKLRFDGAVPGIYLHPMVVAICIWSGAKLIAFVVGGVRGGYWRYTSVHEVYRIIWANSTGSLLGGTIIVFLLGPTGIPRSMYFLEWLISIFLTLGGRFVIRVVITTKTANQAEALQTRTLVYGAGAAGLTLVEEIRRNRSLMCNVIGLIDDDPRKVGSSFQGKRVLGTGETLGELVRKHNIKRVLIAIPSATGLQMVRILKFAVDAAVDYKMVPSLGNLIQGMELEQQIRDVAVEDLLGRKPVQLDQDRIRERVEGTVVMVTGAAGSIGSEICRQIAQFGPLALVGFDIAETPLFQLERELGTSFPQLAFYAELGDITRSETLQHVMQKYRPSILYHAAAYKHVPMMERHIFAAVENNVFGTSTVARAAINHGVKHVVMISTDKAVRPTSMMGATKRVAELVIRAVQKETDTKFMVVRFGNVLGSNGSVVPIFKEQIAAGGPVTVTHAEMRRYFMTIPEAAQLVLQAFSIGKGGEVFVLDMGKPVKILDLARNLILLSGLRPDRDIKIQFTGLRPGEKLFEELNLQDECLIPTSHTQIRSFVSPNGIDVGQIKACIQDLQQIVARRDVARLILLLKQLIPEYSPGSQLLRGALPVESNSAELVKGHIPARQAESLAWARRAGAGRMRD
jgi:FlaA1/EpsC-like NDP-sugar epimerase